MGAETKQLLNLANAAPAALDHLNGVLVEVTAFKGAASWLKLRKSPVKIGKAQKPLQGLAGIWGRGRPIIGADIKHFTDYR